MRCLPVEIVKNGCTTDKIIYASYITDLLAATALILLLMIVSQTTCPVPLLQRSRCTAVVDATRTQFSTKTFNWSPGSVPVTAICQRGTYASITSNTSLHRYASTSIKISQHSRYPCHSFCTG